jgi:GH25 family lysozyme M1 (1,4-beta-N-acetylmuramidase)
MKYNLKKPAVLDVSRWQGQVDWSLVAPRPTLVICKASEGTDSSDSTFASNWNNLKSLSIRRGAYHFFHVELDPAQQFANYQNAVMQGGGFLQTDLPPALGIEGLETASPEIRRAAAASIKTWLDQAQAFSGKAPVIYTSKYQWSFVTDANGKPPAWSSNYPLWVAWYPDKPDKFSAPPASVIPTGWTQWAIWQYSENGQVTGFNVPVDVDILSDWFAKQLDQTNPPGTQVYNGTVVTPSGVNVRVQPTISAKKIGALAVGTVVKGRSIKVVSPSEAWLELTDPMLGWCAIVYGGTTLISVNPS